MRKEPEQVAVPLPGSGGPFVAAGVTDPAAIQYRQALEERMKARPSGGAPSIPLLNSEARSGATMAEQAAASRPPAAAPGSIFEAPPAARPSAGLLPQDMLPDEATRDPAYRDGSGARYATAQPQLAHKYGVMRNGQLVPPQKLVPPKPGLSTATAEGIQALEAFNRTRQQAESTDPSVEAAAAAGSAGAAARLANPSGDPNVAPTTEAERKEVERALKQLDDFDFNKFREAMMKDIINNDEQRKIIEERLKPIELDDLLVNGTVTQFIPIVPGKFEPELQDLSGETDLALKRLIMEESKSIEINSRYFLDKYSLMSVAAGLRSINRNPLPDYRNAEGNFDDALFWAKFNRVMKFNFHMLASLGVNFFWFDVRVRKLFVAEKLKNG